MSASQPSNINSMMEAIVSSGLAFANRYEVIINAPALYSFSSTRQLLIRCDSVVIPGRSFNTVPYRIYGPARNMPVEQIYSGEINLSFILSADLRERNAFEVWMNAISSVQDYKMSYYQEYAGLMQINVLNREDKITYTANVEEVYPKSIGDIQMGYEKDNEILRQDVVLSFRKYTPIFTVPGTQLVQPANQIFGP